MIWMKHKMLVTDFRIRYSSFRWIWNIVCCAIYVLVRFSDFDRPISTVINLCSYVVITGGAMSWFIDNEIGHKEKCNGSIIKQFTCLPAADKIMVVLLIIISFMYFPFEDKHWFGIFPPYTISAQLATLALFGMRKPVYRLLFTSKPFRMISTYILLNMILACFIVIRLFS